VGKGIDPHDHVSAGLEALTEFITPRTAWLIEHHMEAHALHEGTLGVRARRRLEESPDFDELVLLSRCDRAGRVRGAQVSDVDDALDHLRDLARPVFTASCGSSGSRSPKRPWHNTSVAALGSHRRRPGGRSSPTTCPSSRPSTSSPSPPRPSACSSCSSSCPMTVDGSCTSTSPRTRPPSGRPSSSVRRGRGTQPRVSSSTIGTASTARSSATRYGAWGPRRSSAPLGRLGRIRSSNGSSAHFAGSASTT